MSGQRSIAQDDEDKEDAPDKKLTINDSQKPLSNSKTEDTKLVSVKEPEDDDKVPVTFYDNPIDIKDANDIISVHNIDSELVDITPK